MAAEPAPRGWEDTRQQIVETMLEAGAQPEGRDPAEQVKELGERVEDFVTVLAELDDDVDSTADMKATVVRSFDIHTPKFTKMLAVVADNEVEFDAVLDDAGLEPRETLDNLLGRTEVTDEELLDSAGFKQDTDAATLVENGVVEVRELREAVDAEPPRNVQEKVNEEFGTASPEPTDESAALAAAIEDAEDPADVADALAVEELSDELAEQLASGRVPADMADALGAVELSDELTEEIDAADVPDELVAAVTSADIPEEQSGDRLRRTAALIEERFAMADLTKLQERLRHEAWKRDEQTPALDPPSSKKALSARVSKYADLRRTEVAAAIEVTTGAETLQMPDEETAPQEIAAEVHEVAADVLDRPAAESSRLNPSNGSEDPLGADDWMNQLGGTPDDTVTVDREDRDDTGRGGSGHV